MDDLDEAIIELLQQDGHLSHREIARAVGEVSHRVDETDLALLRALQHDGRASYVQLASLIGLSPAGVRRRIVRLLDERVVRVGAVVRRSRADRQAAMGLGLRLEGGHEEGVAALGQMPAIGFVARTQGRFDASSRCEPARRPSLSTPWTRCGPCPTCTRWRAGRISRWSRTYEAVGLASG
ncbi:MAG: AsnC family transcriptional regulator [Nocardioidaceae bacterium]